MFVWTSLPIISPLLSLGNTLGILISRTFQGLATTPPSPVTHNLLCGPIRSRQTRSEHCDWSVQTTHQTVPTGGPGPVLHQCLAMPQLLSVPLKVVGDVDLVRNSSTPYCVFSSASSKAPSCLTTDLVVFDRGIFPLAPPILPLPMAGTFSV